MRGFTLVELLIVIAILAIIAALSIPFFQSFQSSSDLFTQANSIAKAIRRAQQQSLAGQNGSGWGVYFDDTNKKFILFQGSDYASRNAAYDLETSYPDVFILTTDFGDEVAFPLHSAQPTVAGSVTLSGPTNENEIISFDSIGLIQVE